MTGVYVQKRNRVTILSMGKLWLKAYDPERPEEEMLVAQDVLYGNHTELATYRFIKKYIHKGWTINYVDMWHDEYMVVGAMLNKDRICISGYEEVVE